MLLVLAMLLSLFPGITPKAYAAGTLNTISGLTASWTDASSSKGAASWSADGKTITGTATGYKQIVNRTVDTKLTLTNTSGGEATLSFDYTLTGGGKVSGAISSESGSYSVDLADKAYITITLTSPSGENKTNTLSITGLSLISTNTGNVTITFEPVEGGSYTVAEGSGTAEIITAETSKTAAVGTEYTLSATAASGYQFVGWYDEISRQYVSFNAEYSFNSAKDMTLAPKFIPDSLPIFGVGSERFFDLDEACQYAKTGDEKAIILLNDCTISGSYTIPAGTTLVIPFDSTNAYFTTAPEYTTTASTPTVYRTLTLAAGASITVEGAISVGAKHYTSSGTNNGNPTGGYGQIRMQEGSSITVKSGANLYAWGYITGSGHITAESGASVYEYFQITDWRGGTAASGMLNNKQKVFPFSQYYVQNIEAPLTLMYGAQEKVFVSITAGGTTASTMIPFVGDSAMFELSEGGSFTKTYDSAADRIVFDVNGSLSLNSISLTLKVSFLTYNINSQKYVLPINNNVTLNIHSGTTTVNQDVALLPGVQVGVDSGAELKVAAGSSVYVYDQDQWDTYCQGGRFKSVVYSPTRAKTRSNADLVDVVMDVNGTLTANGYLYTTEGGADIKTSAGTGTVVLTNVAGTATTTYQATQSNSDITYVEIPITAAKLHNGSQYVGTEDEYTLTAGAVAGTSYTYNQKEAKWAAPCTEHTPGEAVKENEIAPTCTETGYYDSVVCCTVCGKEISRETITVPAAGHQYSESVTKGATCTETGVATYTCSVCGDSYTREIPALGHAYVDVVTAPTCTEQGYTTHTCSRCGDSYVDSYVDALGHSWNAGEVTTEASCTDEGVRTFTCTVCGATKTEAISAAGHTVVTDPAVAPTCTEPGLTEGSHCSVCGAVIVEQQVVAATGHGYAESVTKVATCTETGVKTYTCSACGDTYTETIPALDHDYLITVTKEATCTATGEKTHTCSRCGDTYTEEIPALGHNYQDKVTAPTCTEQGYTTHTCSRCDDSYADTYVEALGHQFGEGVVTAEATCTTPGTLTFTCAVCSETKTETIPAKGHTYSGVITTPATCTVDGVMTFTCANCGDSYTEVIPAAGHTEVIDEAVPASCTETGLTEGKHCSVCKEILTAQEATEALGHDYSAETSLPSETKPCVTTYTCSRCQDTYTEYVTGLYSVGEDTYYLDKNSLAVTGLVRLVTETGEINYYYFAVQENVEENPDLEVTKAVKNLLPEGGKDCWIYKTNGLALPEWGYFFDANGVILHDADTSKNGIYADDGVLYYYVDGVKAPAGLIKIGDDYYYANSKGRLIVNQTYYCTRMNGLLEEGSYAFDENGKLIQPDRTKDGIVAENGSLYYYKDGQITYAGLIEIDGDYYYVRSSGEVVHGQTYWISWTHGLMEAGYYTFDESGKMIETKNGIYAEEGSLYYYKNNERTYAGLIELDGDYYYVRSSSEVVHGCTYYITWTHELMEAGYYTFDEDGKLIGKAEAPKNGIYEENGSLYYYKDGQITYMGLIEIDGAYYYVRSSGEVVHGQTYYISWTHGLMDPGYYTFADDGRMILP